MAGQSKVYLVCLHAAKKTTQHSHPLCFKVYYPFKGVFVYVWCLLRGSLLVVFYQWWTLLRRCRNKKEVCQFLQFVLQVFTLEMDSLKFKIVFVFGAEIMISISRKFFRAKGVDLGEVGCKKLAKFNGADQMVWCVILHSLSQLSLLFFLTNGLCKNNYTSLFCTGPVTRGVRTWPLNLLWIFKNLASICCL